MKLKNIVIVIVLLGVVALAAGAAWTWFSWGSSSYSPSKFYLVGGLADGQSFATEADCAQWEKSGRATCVNGVELASSAISVWRQLWATVFVAFAVMSLVAFAVVRDVGRRKIATLE